WEICGFSSTFTLARTTWPSVSPTTFSRMGPRVRQGPHQGAHRSTTTGVVSDRSSTSVWNVESVTSMTIGCRLPARRYTPDVRGLYGEPAMTNAPTTDTGSPKGIDAARVTDWFLAHAGDVQPPLEFELIAGGRSNLTYRVADAAGRRWVLRRPPLGQVLATAHDMAREQRVVAALAPAEVPVAPVVGLCTDESVNGAPFYVMEFVEGVVARDAAAARALDVAARARAGEQLADVLARIHAV